MADVELYHPELGETIRVRERAVRVYERSGWILAGAQDPTEMTSFEVEEQEEES